MNQEKVYVIFSGTGVTGVDGGWSSVRTKAGESRDFDVIRC